jgi:hypothetical protein
MKLYYSDVLSPHKACAVARYLKSPVEFAYLDLVKGEQQAPAYLVLNPNGKVPTLVALKRRRYRGLTKNTAQLHTLFALANLDAARAGPDLTTPGLCLHPENNNRKPRYKPISTECRPLPGPPPSQTYASTAEPSPMPTLFGVSLTRFSSTVSAAQTGS